MSRLERFILVGLVVLVILAAFTVAVAPRLQKGEWGQRTAGQDDPISPDQPLEPGESETMSARVIEVLEEGTVELSEGSTQPYQRLLLLIESGSMAGQELVVEEGTVNIISQERLFDPGDRVYVERTFGIDGDRFYVSDFVRTPSLLLIAGLFVTLVVLAGRGKGVRSLGGTLFSLVVIFAFVVPQIVAGRDPIFVSIVGSIVLLAVSNYLIYGWNPRAHAAVGGMMVSLTLTGVLAWLAVGWARLTGLTAEESSYLVMELGPDVNLQGLLLGGIIIGSMGALDDICVSQVSVVFELADADPGMSWTELFRRSFNVGQDHIAAMVNTLVLAYTGASLPLILAFSLYKEPLWRRLNREPIAEEIVRTLVGSIGLILAAPITSLIASLLAPWVAQRERAKGSGTRMATPSTGKPVEPVNGE